MNRILRAPGRARASGFSMIEVLVSLLVLALGLLGFALLQTMNLRYTQSANYRTQATILANDLLDQMRVNRLAAADYASATFNAGDVDGGDCDRPTGENVPITGDEGVIARWQCQVVAVLGPQATAEVSYEIQGGLATVRLTWGERLAADPHTSFIVETRL